MIDLQLWQWVGVALMLWLAWDLIAGYTYIHRKVKRIEEPALYWVVMLVWAAIAVVMMLGIWK